MTDTQIVICWLAFVLIMLLGHISTGSCEAQLHRQLLRSLKSLEWTPRMTPQQFPGPHHQQLMALTEETEAVAAALLLLTASGAQLEIAVDPHCPEAVPLLGKKLRAAADQLSPSPDSLLWQRVQAVSPN